MAQLRSNWPLGKGRKDRYVPISPKLLKELRDYWQIAKPTIYLFPGKTPDVPLHDATIQICCKLAASQARLNKHVTPHTLRHSYATGLLEAGVDLMAISRLLGTAASRQRWSIFTAAGIIWGQHPARSIGGRSGNAPSGSIRLRDQLGDRRNHPRNLWKCS